MRGVNDAERLGRLENAGQQEPRHDTGQVGPVPRTNWRTEW